MSQGIFDNIVPTTTSGNQLAIILNDFKDAVVSGFSGTSRPSQLDPGGYWIDISQDSSGIWVYKMYDGAQDIPVFTLNKNTGTVSISSADGLFQITKSTADAAGPVLKLLKGRIADNGQAKNGDTVGDIQMGGRRDDGQPTTQARLRAVTTNHVTTTQQGAYLTFEIAPTNGASLVEVLRLIDGKAGFNVSNPEETIHLKGTGFKIERESDDANGPIIKVKKKRVANSGKVLNGDAIGTMEFQSTDTLGAETPVVRVEVIAAEDHTVTNQGTKILVKNKKVGQAAFTEQIEIGDIVTVKNKLVVEGDFEVKGTTTSFDTETLEVEDANILVNKGGTQAVANTSKAGFTVSMTDATDARIGYDSSKASKFVAGEEGSESELITSTHTQTMTNKTLNGATIKTPVKSEVKQDTLANITAWAASGEGTNGQWCFATDTKEMYHIVDGSLMVIGPGIQYSAVNLTGTNIDWNVNTTVFYKDTTVDQTFTFSNLKEGKTINVIINNTGGSAITITFPTAKKESFFTGMISSGKEAVFTLTRSNGKTYIGVLTDMA